MCNKIFTYAYYVVHGGTGSGDALFDLSTLMWDYIEDENTVWFSVKLSNEYKKSVRKDIHYIIDRVSTLINGGNIVIHKIFKGFDDYDAKFFNKDSDAYSNLVKGVVHFCVKTSFDLEFND